MNIASYRKIIAYVLGLVAAAISAGLIHGSALMVASAIIALATGLGIYGVKNEPVPTA